MNIKIFAETNIPFLLLSIRRGPLSESDCSSAQLFTWVKVFRIYPEVRILRLTLHRKSASKYQYYQYLCDCSYQFSLTLPLQDLWANDYKGKGISWHYHYIFCSRVMLGTACTCLVMASLRVCTDWPEP